MIPSEFIDQVVTGDCRELARQIPDGSVEMVLTDPPFGIGFDYGNGYDDSPEGYEELVRWIVEESTRILRPGGLAFVYQAQPRLRLMWAIFPPQSRIFAACKNFVQMRPTPVQFAYDPVIFWQKTGEPLKPPQGRDWHVGNTANTNNRGEDEAGFHACPRPLTTIRYMVEHFCPVGGIVADFFMGSGTTAVAAKQTGRRFCGFELDADTAEQARKRVSRTPLPLPLFLPDPPPAQHSLDLEDAAR